MRNIFSFVLNIAYGYKKYYFIMLLPPIFQSFFPTLSSYAIKLIVDIFIRLNSIQEIVYPVILFFVSEISVHLMWKISNIIEWNVEPIIKKRIILKVYDHIQSQSFLFFKENLSGNIINKINGFLVCYDRLWKELYSNLSVPILSAIISISSLFFVSKIVGIFMLFWAIFFVFVNYVFGKDLMFLSKEATNSQHSLIGLISDKISNIESILLFNLHKKEYNKIEKAINEDFIPKKVKLSKYVFIMQLILTLSCIFMYACVFYVAINAKINNKITTGDFVFIFNNIFFIVYRIFKVLSSVQDFIRVLGDLKSSISLLELDFQIKNTQNATNLVVKNPSIVFKNISFGYRSNYMIFKDFNLIIKSGEKIGIVGNTGTGKTTLIKLLLKYFLIQNGEIFIDNKNIYTVTQESLRNNISTIQQDITLFRDTIEENIKCGKLTATKDEFLNACILAGIHNEIMQIPDNYQAIIGEYGVQFSTGQKQQIAIARAILKNSPIMILDEATSNLDSITEQKIQQSINHILNNKEKTIIVITHRLSTIKHLDRIVVINDGKIVEDGNFDYLISTKTKFKDMCDKQIIQNQ